MPLTQSINRPRLQLKLLRRSYRDAAAEREAGGLNAFTHKKYIAHTKQKTNPPRRTSVQNRVQRLQKSGGGDEGRDTVRVHVRRRPPVLVVPALLRVRGTGDADAAEA